MKIGEREFKDEEELCAFLTALVHKGEAKMKRGAISCLCYEDMIMAWSEMIEKAHDEGWLTDAPNKALCAALAGQVNMPYSDAAMRLADEEYDAFGLHGLSTDV